MLRSCPHFEVRHISSPFEFHDFPIRSSIHFRDFPGSATFDYQKAQGQASEQKLRPQSLGLIKYLPRMAGYELVIVLNHLPSGYLT